MTALGLNFRGRAGAIAAMIPLGQGVKHAVGAKNKIVLLVDPSQRVIGIIAMTTSTVVLTLLKEHPPPIRHILKLF